MSRKRPSAEERSAAIDRFIEEMGRFYEQSGTSRIGGRMLALLVTAEHPLSAEQLAEQLSVSRSSVSSNLKLHLARGSMEPVTYPGDRLTYYSFSWATWEQRTLQMLGSYSTMEDIVKRVMGALGTDDPAYKRLVEFERWVRLFLNCFEQVQRNWPKRGAAEVSHGR
jgi:predicted transcriptional regulator